MNPTLVMFFFFATAPVALMPAIISLLTRHAWRWRIAAANLALWAVLFFAARGFSLGASSQFRLPTFLALVAWLVLLGYSIRGKRSPTGKAK